MLLALMDQAQAAFTPYPLTALSDFSVATIDPWVGVRDPATPTRYKLANRAGVRSPQNGDPYFALTHAAPFNLTLPNNHLYMQVVMVFESLPQQLAGPDEHHPVISLFEEGPAGRDLAYIAVTPSGRIVGKAYDYPLVIQSGAGVIQADGRPHIIGFTLRRNLFFGDFLPPDTMALEFDGLVIQNAAQYANDILPQQHTASRYMLFNGRSGISRYRATMAYALAMLTDGAGGPTIHCVEWDFGGNQDVIEGTEAPGFGLEEGDVSFINPPFSLQTGFDWDMRAVWYDPSVNGLALPWGQIPSVNPKFDRLRLGQLRSREASSGLGAFGAASLGSIAPTAVPVGTQTFRTSSLAGSYKSQSPTNPNYRRS